MVTEEHIRSRWRTELKRRNDPVTGQWHCSVLQLYSSDSSFASLEKSWQSRNWNKRAKLPSFLLSPTTAQGGPLFDANKNEWAYRRWWRRRQSLTFTINKETKQADTKFNLVAMALVWGCCGWEKDCQWETLRRKERNEKKSFTSDIKCRIFRFSSTR